MIHLHGPSGLMWRRSWAQAGQLDPCPRIFKLEPEGVGSLLVGAEGCEVCAVVWWKGAVQERGISDGGGGEGAEGWRGRD